MTIYGARLKSLRKRENITQNDLAAKLNVTKGTVSTWETDNRKPSFDKLVEICTLFDVSLDYLLARSDDASSQKLSENEVAQLGAWELETHFQDILMSYLALDDFGKSAVENLIQAEKLRCHEQATLCNTDGIKLNIYIKP